MQNSMSIVLLIQNPDVAARAFDAVSEFLVYRRRLPAASGGEEILGIWVSSGAGEPWPPGLPDGGGTAGSDPLRIRESCSLAGVWTLCWLEGPALGEVGDSGARRLAVLDALAGSVSAAAGPAGAFVPVFGEAESPDAIGAALDALRDRYPGLIDGRWSVNDPAHGLVAGAGTLQ